MLCWTAPVILFIGLSNVIGLQILYPLGKESIVIWSTVGGAVLNLLLNLWLIPSYGAIGAAISTCGAEFIVLFIQITVGSKYLPFRIYKQEYLNYFFASTGMALILYGMTMCCVNDFFLVSSCIVIGTFVYSGILWFKQDKLFLEVLTYATKLIKKIK